MDVAKLLVTSHDRNFSEVIKDCDGGNNDAASREVKQNSTPRKTIARKSNNSRAKLKNKNQSKLLCKKMVYKSKGIKLIG